MMLTSLSASLRSSSSSLTGPTPSNSNGYFSSSLPSPRRRLNPKPNHHHHRNRHLSLPFLSRTSPTHSIHCSSSSSSMPLEVSTSSSQYSLLYSRAFWVTQCLIAWNVDVVRDGSCYLYASQTAALSVTDSEVEGHDFKIKLEEDSCGIPQNVIVKFPHIRDYKAFRVPSTVDAKSLVKCQLAVATFGSDGKCSYATGLQLPGVLDELFAYDGPLGAHYSEDAVSLYLWAPTAQAVRACVYKNADSRDPVEVVPLKEVKGVWSVEGSKDWEGCYYVYEVSVYHPSTLHVEKCYANDPYARGLSPDSQRTLFVNLDSDTLKPEGWEKLADEKPIILCFSDISIYELHLRDFSANDHTVHPDFQGGYLAFTLEDSAGVLHLKKLSNAGITHVHLLPSFQFAGVDDVKENWKCVDSAVLEKLPPDSIEQQAQITSIQDDDGYNWGYNPVLWGVPKGSYASNPSGSCRTIEFRKMVQSKFSSYKKVPQLPFASSLKTYIPSIDLDNKERKMEDHYSLLNGSCFYQDEGIEDLRQYLLYTTELETAIVSAKEEITRREIEIFNLKDLLSRTVKERNEAQIQCQKLVLNKLALQQQLLQNQQQQQQEMQPLRQESASLARTYSSEDESKASDSNNHISSPDSSKVIVPSQFSDPIPQQPSQSSLPEVIFKLAADKPLPEKGKLLQAVKEAGPLLQTLLLAGPLPQWQHPPPQLDSIEIPPVTISSQTARLIHQDSFNSLPYCLSKKRDRELYESPDSSSPTNKYQKVVLH